MGGLSKVTHYLFDAFKGPDMELHQGPAEELFQGLDAELQQGPARGSSDLLSDHLPGLDFNQLKSQASRSSPGLVWLCPETHNIGWSRPVSWSGFYGHSKKAFV